MPDPMADLKAAISAQLDAGIEDLEAALRARGNAIREAIDFHYEEGPAGENYCGRCTDNWPCEELRAIAEELGIEVEDD